MKPDIKKLLLALGLPLAVGGLAALLSGGMGLYRSLNQPPLSPPGWVFPIVWTVLYLLMGYASYRAATSQADPRAIRRALLFYGLQLGVNFLWPILFFRFRLYLTSFIVLVVLWVLLYITMWLFSKLDEKAGDLLIPYLLWVTFAGYLNLGVFLLN